MRVKLTPKDKVELTKTVQMALASPGENTWERLGAFFRARKAKGASVEPRQTREAR